MKDFDVVKYATMLENGFQEDDFSSKVKNQSKKIHENFIQDVKKFKFKKETWGSKHQIQDFRNILTFSIDGKNTRAMDDAISIEQVIINDQSHFRIMIHISSIHSYINANSELDKESAKKVTSYYIGKYFFKSMLPRILYTQVGSFTQNDDKFGISVEFLMNEDGVIIFEGEHKFKYHKSIINNDLRLSYELANKIMQGEGK
jgi:ribonuclease R